MCWVITTPTPANLFQQIYTVRNEVILFLSWFIFSEVIPEYCSIAGVETVNNCKMENQMLNGSDCLGEVLHNVGQNSKLFSRCLCHGYLENYAAMWTIWRMMCEQPLLPTIPTLGELSDRSGRFYGYEYDYYGYYFTYGALINPPTGKLSFISQFLSFSARFFWNLP